MQETPPFRERGRDVTRVEAFSDIVFGFALTLIVVSLEVPRSFDQLLEAMRGFPAFAICFAVLTWVWFCHHSFFRRYALTDGTTITLNAALLFVVLFYTYPMKFMFSMITRATRASSGNASQLFLIYGLGFAGIFALLLAMHAHAWRKRDELELNVYERHDTVTNMQMYAAYVALGLASVAIGLATTGPWVAMAGFIYFLIGPVSGYLGWKRGAQRQSLHVEAAQTAPKMMQTDAVLSVAAAGPNRSDAMPVASPDKAIVNVTNP